MKIKNLVRMFAVVALASMASLNSARACSMMPADAEKETQGLEQMAYAALGIGKSNVVKTTKTGAQADYIWTDPMCPEGVKARAVFRVDYNHPADKLARGCIGTVIVTKQRPTGLSEKRVVVKYTAELGDESYCLE